MRIGILSDTHGYLDAKIEHFFKDCDEIWHCGDIGRVSVVEQLKKHSVVRAVYGNIDGGEVRQLFSEMLLFSCCGVKVLMTHIGGYPGHYESKIKSVLEQEQPQLFVCGHSHILKVMHDRKLDCLHINPGAAGKFGFHKVRTAVRLVVEEGNIKDLEILELEK